MPPMMTAEKRLTWAVVGWSAAFVATLVLSIAVVVLLAATGVIDDRAADDPAGFLALRWLVVLQIPLWVGLVGTPLLARRYGLDWRDHIAWSGRRRDVLTGTVTAVLLQFLLIPLLYWPILHWWGDLDVEGPARDLVDSAVGSVDVGLLVLMTVVAAPLCEEIFFRGLLQRAIADKLGERRLGAAIAVTISATVFALTHFQPIQFPALLLVGLVLGTLAHRTGRLAPAVWCHAVFNGVTTAVLLW